MSVATALHSPARATILSWGWRRAAIAQVADSDVDLELALFEADHDPGDAALAQARRALEDRPSILGHDVVAWNLHRVGREEEAADEMALALATGSRDPLLRFHAAAIAEAAGHPDDARDHLRIVLDANPRFSAAHVDEVEDLARRLGLEVPSPPACRACP